MAKRRMFSSEITTSDSFLDMSLSAQALYFHLGMYADDDGVVNNYKTIVRTIGAKDDDLKLLVLKRFVIPINDPGIIVIKHWKINNYIQKDRYTPSNYRKDLKILQLDENGCYAEKSEGIPALDTDCIQNGYTGKDSKDKDSLVKDSKELDKNNSLADNAHAHEPDVFDAEEEDDDDKPF